MKLKNDQEIEELALTHISQFEADDYENVTQYSFHTIGEKDGFIRGYTQAQQDLLASASEGFEEYIAKFQNWMLVKPEVANYYKSITLEAWQAANIRAIKMFNSTDDLVRMSYITECLEIHYESEIERLQKENEELKVSIKLLEMNQHFMEKEIKGEAK